MHTKFPLKNKVMILGSSERSLKDAPLVDESYTVIALPAFESNRVDLYFEMHDRKKWRKETFPYLVRSETFVVCQKFHDDIPNSLEYPLDEVKKKIGKDYFTSSIAYILAFILMQDQVEEVALFGIDLVTDSEYKDQRPCVEYLLGVLSGKGVKITIPNSSALLKSPRNYGYESKQEGSISLSDLLQRKKTLDSDIDELKTVLNRLVYARDETDFYINKIKANDRGFIQ